MTVKLRILIYACILLCKCVPSFALTKISRTLLNAEFNDVNISESEIFETFPVSLIYCDNLCLDTENCLSFSYNKLTRTCMLFSVDFTSKESTHHTLEIGWLYYHLIRDFKKRPEGCDYFGTYHVCSVYCFNYVTRNDYSNLTSECRDLDGEIVRIDRELKQFCVEKLLENVRNGEIYIQGRKESGKWRYTDGTEMAYYKWNTEGGQPSNIPGEIYLGIRKTEGYLWHDVLFNSFKAAVCRKS